MIFVQDIKVDAWKLISKLKLLKKRKLNTCLIIFKFLETNVNSIEIGKEFT